MDASEGIKVWDVIAGSGEEEVVLVIIQDEMMKERRKRKENARFMLRVKYSMSTCVPVYLST